MIAELKNEKHGLCLKKMILQVLSDVLRTASSSAQS